MLNDNQTPNPADASRTYTAATSSVINTDETIPLAVAKADEESPKPPAKAKRSPPKKKVTAAADYVALNLRVRPEFKAQVHRDAKHHKRSMNEQVMAGYGSGSRNIAKADRDLLKCLGDLGAWINDNDVPEIQRRHFADILISVQMAAGDR